MDTDTLLIHDLFKHIFPDFSLNHVIVFKELWKIEPLTGEQVIECTGLSRATGFKILSELVACGLIKRTSFKPIGYYSDNPEKVFVGFSQKIVSKLRRGQEQIKKIVSNSSGQSNEKYLIKLDGGQSKLIDLKTHQELEDEQKLREYKEGIVSSIQRKERQKLKAWQLVGMV